MTHRCPVRVGRQGSPFPNPSNVRVMPQKIHCSIPFSTRNSPTVSGGEPIFKAPNRAKLALKVRAAQANKLIIVIDGYAAEVELAGGKQWQDVVLSLADFQDAANEPLPSWENIKQLKLCPTDRLRPKRGTTAKPRLVGKNWVGIPPEFRDLRWRLPEDSK